MTNTLGLWLVGSSGRMGGAIQKVVAGRSDMFIAGHITSAGADRSVEEHGSPIVVVDFSSPEGCLLALRFADQYGYPMVSGTTGLPSQTHDLIDEVSQRLAIVHAHNMSQGVQVLLHLAGLAAGSLPEWQTEILELHHQHTQDAPSGTAVSRGHAINEGRHQAPRDESTWVHGRSGHTGPRPAAELGMHAVRGGDVVGEHTVFYFGEGERIELTHRVTDQAIFARGAVRAAAWVASQPAGRYTMQHVLGLA